MLYTISIIASTIVLCATALHLQAADHSEAMQSLLARCEAAQWDNQGSVTLMECSTLPDQYITGKAQPAPIF